MKLLQWLAGFLLVAALFGGIGWSAYHEQQRDDATFHGAGMEVGRDGLPPECCPYNGGWGTQRKREKWMQGWAEGVRRRGSQ